MKETLSSKLTRMAIKDGGITQFDIELKCKTKDGMIFTLDVMECKREKDETALNLAELADRYAIENLCEISRDIDAGEGYITSLYEYVTIKKSEIVRVWIELGATHTNSPVELYEAMRG